MSTLVEGEGCWDRLEGGGVKPGREPVVVARCSPADHDLSPRFWALEGQPRSCKAIE